MIGIWAVVVDGRVFARSWKQSAGGWCRTFLDDPLGVLEVGGRRVRIRAVRARGERIRDDMKYPWGGPIGRLILSPGGRPKVRGRVQQSTSDKIASALPRIRTTDDPRRTSNKLSVARTVG